MTQKDEESRPERFSYATFFRPKFARGGFQNSL